ncbi:MAG: general stress protein [Micrococcales bacterium]
MSNVPSSRKNRNLLQSIPDGVSVAEFNNYGAAVDCVDQLIRHEFPAPMVAIVGSDLKTVERVRGKLSYGRVALSGAITGSWLGLIFGLFFGSAGTDATASAAQATSMTTFSVGSAIVIGAGLGMLFNVLRFSMSRNRHEFMSASSVVAASYQVLVPEAMQDQARNAIREHQEKCINGQ